MIIQFCQCRLAEIYLKSLTLLFCFVYVLFSWESLWAPLPFLLLSPNDLLPSFIWFRWEWKSECKWPASCFRAQSSKLHRSKRACISEIMLIRINPLVLCILPLVFLLTEARTRPSGNDRIVFPKDDDDTSSRFTYSTTTTTEEPASTIALRLESTNSTEQITSGSEELVNENTTVLPVIDNRILLETTQKCKPGFELFGKRCRKPA